jgi:hypothetical protein
MLNAGTEKFILQHARVQRFFAAPFTIFTTTTLLHLKTDTNFKDISSISQHLLGYPMSLHPSGVHSILRCFIRRCWHHWCLYSSIPSSKL